MRVLVCASGTIGDLHPLVAIAAAMRRRGHEVYLLANSVYESLAAEANVAFEPVGTREEHEQVTSHPQLWTYARGWKLWIRGGGIAPMRKLYASIEKLACPNETIVVAAYLCFGAHVAREKLRLPTATVHLNVHTIRTAHGVYAYPPPWFLPDWLPRSYVLPQWSPAWYRYGALRCADRLFIDPVMGKEIRQFRRELGLPELRTHIRKWWSSPHLVVGLFPDWWAGYHPDWPPSLVMTGFPFWDRSETKPISEELQKFLDDADGIIVFTPGASMNHTQRHFSAFQKTCQRLGRKGLIITPKQLSSLDSSDGVRFERYVPFRKLLPYASAVVHQAGIGTTAHCLAAGVPQIVAPTFYNQPDTAVRLQRLGVAHQVSSRRFAERKLTRALDELIKSPDVALNCAKYAKLTRGCNALEDLCPHLEELPRSKAFQRNQGE